MAHHDFGLPGLRALNFSQAREFSQARKTKIQGLAGICGKFSIRTGILPPRAGNFRSAQNFAGRAGNFRSAQEFCRRAQEIFDLRKDFPPLGGRRGRLDFSGCSADLRKFALTQLRKAAS